MSHKNKNANKGQINKTDQTPGTPPVTPPTPDTKATTETKTTDAPPAAKPTASTHVNGHTKCPLCSTEGAVVRSTNRQQGKRYMQCCNRKCNYRFSKPIEKAETKK